MGDQISFSRMIFLLIILFAVVGGTFLAVEAVSFMVAGVDAPALAAVIPGEVSGSPLFDTAFIPRQFNPWGIDANRFLT